MVVTLLFRFMHVQKSNAIVLEFCEPLKMPNDLTFQMFSTAGKTFTSDKKLNVENVIGFRRF